MSTSITEKKDFVGFKLLDRNHLPIIKTLIFFFIILLAFSVRLFAVIRFESVIHEFDPYFNFRTTQVLSEKGFYEWWNWFDSASWYPLGRVVGQTLFPGLMVTAYLMHRIVNFFGILIHVRDICVFTAPIFSGFTALAVYGYTKQVTGKEGGGLFAALFMALSPTYMSRSVAGSYDNEAVAIFALIFAFYAYVRALNHGTSFSAFLASLTYFYMAASWGGYVFITNTIAIHTLALIILNQLTLRHYLVFSIFYIMGTLFCYNVPFIHLQAIRSSEHMASHCVFLVIQILFFTRMFISHLPKRFAKVAKHVLTVSSVVVIFSFALWLALTGRTRWSSRSLTLLDPTYASKHNPIVASVSEHQSPIWTNFLFDLHICTLFASVGLWMVFSYPTATSLFAGIYGVIASYFSCVMIRLLLVLSPAFCALSGLAMSFLLSSFLTTESLNPTFTCLKGCYALDSIETDSHDKEKKTSSSSKTSFVDYGVRALGVSILFFMCLLYISHGVFVTSFAYSNPSILQSHKLTNGDRYLEDDFREAYYWMRKNTHPNARLMSWWDYGYQSASMSNRTVIVDNNTWNTTHIATVGLAFSLPEEEAYSIVSNLDVDYVFIVFGGHFGYSSDDINKFYWMLSIANGEFSRLNIHDYFSPQGWLTVGDDATPTFKNSLMYRLSYNNYAQGLRKGTDILRQAQVSSLPPLKYFEEVYTTENWIVKRSNPLNLAKSDNVDLQNPI